MSGKNDFDDLTHNQKMVIDRFGYFLSPDEADKVKNLIGNLKDKKAKEYVKSHGKKVDSEGKVTNKDLHKSSEKDLDDLSTDELLRELILTTNKLNQNITSKLDEQTKKLGNISTAATLFIILSIIGILVGFCSSTGIY